MSERLNIDGLRALLAVATHGGVTRAAEHLALSQPAVSHKIKRLETGLGCALFTRRAGAPLLTDEGTRLLGYARRILALQDEALAAIGTKPLRGAIRMGLTEDVTGGDLARILGRFARAYPEVSLRSRISQSLTLIDWLEKGEIDLAVMQVFAHEQQAGDRVLYEDSLHWVKSPDLRLAHEAPLPLLAFDRNCFYRHWAEAEAERVGRSLVTVMECPSLAGILAATRAGLGLALINARHLSPDLELVEGLLPPPPPIAYVIRPRRKAQNEALRALSRAISDELGDVAAQPTSISPARSEQGLRMLK